MGHQRTDKSHLLDRYPKRAQWCARVLSVLAIKRGGLVDYQAPELVIIGSVVEETLILVDGSLDPDAN